MKHLCPCNTAVNYDHIFGWNLINIAGLTTIICKHEFFLGELPLKRNFIMFGAVLQFFGYTTPCKSMAEICLSQ
jgi:hypothetical protein